ncbi:MAG: calcium/proton exchanger [Bryobacteraceae bacterium]|nr:calcium/proton exchanger [Bryobacteraceae bacterium]
MKNLLKPSLNWLLVFVPVAVGLEFASPESHTLIFVAACVAIIPLAGWLGRATEHLAERTSEGVGGLLNATFGNAAELIIALVALNKGLYGVVKASLTGSIIGNVLLVLGAAIFAGGLKFREQEFNARGARMQSTMLTLAATALLLPAAFHALAGPTGWPREIDISVEISIVLLLTYLASLWFTLKTHKHYFVSPPPETAQVREEEHHQPWPVGRSMVVLGVATGLIAWVSEILVGSVEATAKTFGMTEVFVGVFVVAIVGNAAEHSTAILVAMKNRMDLSLTIAAGSSLQIALFIAPLLVLASLVIGPQPMDLVFTPAEVLAVVLAVVITGQISSDGQSNWLEGLQLLVVYLILGIIFYFLPEAASEAARPAGH